MNGASEEEKKAKGGDILDSFLWRRIEPVLAIVPLDTGGMYLGSTRYDGDLWMIVAKVDDAGDPALDFGEPGLGWVVFRISGWPSRTDTDLAGMAPTTDGGVVLVVASGALLGFACVTPTGELNPAFGNSGTIVHDFTDPSQGEAGATRKDSKPLAHAMSGAIVPAPEGGFYSVWRSNQGGLAKIRADGHLDDSFGNGGWITVAHPMATQTEPTGVTVWGQDHVVVFGVFTDSNGSRSGFAARFHSDGSLDTSFGQQGFAVVTPGDSANQSLKLAAGAVSADGNIFLAGSIREYGFLHALDDKGSPLISFNEGLPVEFGLVGSTQNFQRVVVQEEGPGAGLKVLAGGYRQVVSDKSFYALVARYLPDGNLDKEDFKRPLGHHSFQPFFRNSILLDMVLDRNGRILIAGSESGGDSRGGFVTVMDGS